MTQKDEDMSDKLSRISKSLEDIRKESKHHVKTVKDEVAFQQERTEAENWETFKSKFPPEDHTGLEKLLSDVYNGDVEQLLKNYIDELKQL